MKRNRFTFGFGTIGRDMVYTLISVQLVYYLTDVIKLDTSVLWWITGIILVARIYDALNDPIMGLIVDNTKTRFGKFKPWILGGAIVSGLLTVLLFTDFNLGNTGYIVTFAVIYLCWGMSFTANDIAYWSMLPTLSFDQKEREKIGSYARIFANLGMFFVVAGIVPITTAIGESAGSLQKGYFIFTLIIVGVMWLGQSVTLFGTKEPKHVIKEQSHTSIRNLFKTIVTNDQLLFTAISMVLFMIGYMTTTGFGLYFFKYAYGDEGMYSIFAIILGISQTAALLLYPVVSKNICRKKMYQISMALVVLGYIIFFFAPTTTMIFIGIAGVLMFVGEAWIQLMMLMFLADSVEYGQWKTGKRNDSITFSLQPFINKMGGAIASGIVAVIIILSGIKEADTAAEVTSGGLMMMKAAMLIFPMICIVCAYIIYRRKYKIDEKMYQNILTDLKKRGDVA